MLLTTDRSSPEVKSKYFKTDIDHDVTAFQGNASGTIVTTEAFASENSVPKNTFSVKEKVLTLEERRLKKKRMLALNPNQNVDKNSYSPLSDCSVQSQINNVSKPVQYTPEQADVSNTNNLDSRLAILNSSNSDYLHEKNDLPPIQQKLVHVYQKLNNHDKSKDNSSPITKKFATTSNRRVKDDLLQPCLCVICGKDLTNFNIVTRETHLNRCLDDIEEQEKQQTVKTKQSKQVKKSISPSDDNMFINNDCSWFSLVTNCPCCLKSFPSKSKTAKSKITHMKRCGNKQKFSATKILSLLKEMKQKLATGFVPYLTESSTMYTKDTQLTDYFASVPKEKLVTTKPTTIVSQSYTVSALEGIDQDDDFKSNVIITSVSTIEKIGKRKFGEDSDDDFKVAKVLSKSMMPQYKNQPKKIVYDLNTTPILAPAESIEKARKRAKKMFFDKPTIHDIVRSYPLTSSICPSGQFMKLNGNNEIVNGIKTNTSRKKSKSLWEIQALGGPDNPLSDDDYMTDMLKEWVFKYEPHKLDQYHLQPFRKRYEMCDRCVNKYWGRLQPENEEKDEMIERSYYFCR
ncbi:RNB-domain-containing protein [Gigaspora margarita]|uniref:RNB-domain-containing protein n=1 Tax=Gigaspora margarita TaxID=4874 RepID=A0A8H4AFM3_GIGMA|nr:RNB-domain-containing protein [Gigaspora margarita]